MSYKKTWQASPNFTKGTDTASIRRWWPASNGQRKITAIAIHWWDDPKNKPSFEGVISVLTNPARQASAHYVAESGRVCQLVRESDISWATNSANWFTISIECNPLQRDGDYDTIAELIADIWQRHGKVPLVPHNKYAATRCPGGYSLQRLTVLAEQKLAPPPKPPASKIKYQKLSKPEWYVANKQPTTLWDISGSKWTDFKKVASYDKGHRIRVYGKAIHPLGSTYLMTEWSYNKRNDHGFNAVDLLKETKPIPKEPVDEKPPAPKPPKKGDKTDGDTASGGDRISDDEPAINPVVEFLNKLIKLLQDLVTKLTK